MLDLSAERAYEKSYIFSILFEVLAAHKNSESELSASQAMQLEMDVALHDEVKAEEEEEKNKRKKKEEEEEEVVEGEELKNGEERKSVAIAGDGSIHLSPALRRLFGAELCSFEEVIFF